MRDRRKRITAGAVAVLLPVVCLLLFLSRTLLLRLSRAFPMCTFYEQTGFLCPACGNTRSVRALLKGNIVESIGYNATSVILLIFSLMFYIELALYAFGVKLHIIPRNYCFLVVFLIMLISYYIFRNFIPFLTLC